METLISPGVLARENDQSQITSQPVQAGAAIIGPTVKGKVNVPKLVTTYSEYAAAFGDTFTSGSDQYSFLTSISAYNYFQNGGTSLIVTRVQSGSWSPATSSLVESGVVQSFGNFATASFITGSLTAADTGSGYFDAVVAIEVGNNIYYISPGTFGYIDNGLDYAYVNVNAGSSNWNTNQWSNAVVNTINNTSFELNQYLTASYNAINGTFSISGSLPGTENNGITIYSGIQYIGAPISTGTLLATLGGGTPNVNTNAFVLETLSDGVIMNSTSTETLGALASGSIDNLRWEIVNPNTSSGVFSVLIRRGNDNNVSKTILETFPNVSLDPKSPNYIARIIGDQTYNIVGSGATAYLQATGSFPVASKYVRVKSVNLKTPDYFDNNGVAKAQYVTSIPVAQSGSFGGGLGNVVVNNQNMYQNINNTNTQGLVGDNYATAIALMANTDEYKYNIISTPGLIQANADHASQLNTLVSNTENRGDAIVILDLENYASTITATIGTAAGIDTSYAAAYWPWVQITDPNTQQLVWIPASTLIPGVYASNDRTAEAWFAPAGINRGGMSIVRQAERKLAVADRDALYTGKVNPLATFPGRGVVVFGQKTLQTQASALDRVNVRRLLIELKSFISQVANNLVFEQNTAATRNQFLSQVNPYLQSVQQRQGLYAFKAVMDSTNNTADVIDRNQLVGAIYLQPTKTAEFIYLDFNILPTGVSFS